MIGIYLLSIPFDLITQTTNLFMIFAFVFLFIVYRKLVNFVSTILRKLSCFWRRNKTVGTSFSMPNHLISNILCFFYSILLVISFHLRVGMLRVYEIAQVIFSFHHFYAQMALLVDLVSSYAYSLFHCCNDVVSDTSVSVFAVKFTHFSHEKYFQTF